MDELRKLQTSLKKWKRQIEGYKLYAEIDGYIDDQERSEIYRMEQMIKAIENRIEELGSEIAEKFIKAIGKSVASNFKEHEIKKIELKNEENEKKRQHEIRKEKWDALKKGLEHVDLWKRILGLGDDIKDQIIDIITKKSVDKAVEWIKNHFTKEDKKKEEKQIAKKITMDRVAKNYTILGRKIDLFFAKDFKPIESIINDHFDTVADCYGYALNKFDTVIQLQKDHFNQISYQNKSQNQSIEKKTDAIIQLIRKINPLLPITSQYKTAERLYKHVFTKDKSNILAKAKSSRTSMIFNNSQESKASFIQTHLKQFENELKPISDIIFALKQMTLNAEEQITKIDQKGKGRKEGSKLAKEYYSKYLEFSKYVNQVLKEVSSFIKDIKPPAINIKELQRSFELYMWAKWLPQLKKIKDIEYKNPISEILINRLNELLNQVGVVIPNPKYNSGYTRTIDKMISWSKSYEPEVFF